VIADPYDAALDLRHRNFVAVSLQRRGVVVELLVIAASIAVWLSRHRAYRRFEPR
jgi:hypothetical protein